MPRNGHELPAGGHHAVASDSQWGSATDGQAITDTIADIRAAHRARCFAMENRKRSDLALGSFLRAQLGWSRNLPDAERKRINTQALALIAIGEKEMAGKDADIDEPAYIESRHVILPAIKAKAPWVRVEKDALKDMKIAAASLPVWASFAQDIRGFGEGSLAVIVGEAGDLSIYDNHSKLWKRMGVAVIDGVRQGGLRKGAAKEDWIVHGYSGQRRSRMWNVGDALIKGNRDGKYRALYLERKAFEAARNPEMTKMHAHRRAQRYMEKRLLRDLWQAWSREAGAGGMLLHHGHVGRAPAHEHATL